MAPFYAGIRLIVMAELQALWIQPVFVLVFVMCYFKYGWNLSNVISNVKVFQCVCKISSDPIFYIFFIFYCLGHHPVDNTREEEGYNHIYLCLNPVVSFRSLSSITAHLKSVNLNFVHFFSVCQYGMSSMLWWSAIGNPIKSKRLFKVYEVNVRIC